MSDVARRTAQGGPVVQDLLKARCFRAAYETLAWAGISAEGAGPIHQLEREMDNAYSAIKAARPDFRVADFAAFFLGHVARFGATRDLRQKAYAGTMQFIVANSTKLSPDIASLASGSDDDAQDDAAVDAVFHSSRSGTANDDTGVSEGFLDAYSQLKPAIIPLDASPQLRGGASPVQTQAERSQATKASKLDVAE